MTTTSPAHVRSRRRIGPLSVVWALFAALLTALAFPTPAYASNFVVQANPNSVDVTTGQGGQTVEVTVQNTVPNASGVSATVALEGLDNLADISVDAGDCSGVNGNTVDCGDVQAADQRTFSVTVNPNDNAGLAEGDTSSGTLKITMDGSNQGEGAASVNVIGGQTASITGTVADLDKEPLEGAAVKAKYSDDTGDEATSDKDGKYAFDDPVEGETTITVTADGYQDFEDTITVVSGQDASLTARMEAEEEDSGQETQEANVAGKEEDEGDSSGLSGTSIVLMILGFLLIVGAIVAIVMLIRKGRAEKQEEEKPEQPSTPPIHNPSATQTGQLGVYDSAARPGMDAPTMIHNGPLVRDGERPRPSSAPVSGGYASNEPVSSGFGPAYGTPDAQAGGTQRYPSAEGGGSWGNSYRDAAVGGYSNEPVSGGYRGNEPVSGYGRGNEPVSGSYGYGQQRQEPASGGYRGNEPVSGHSYGYGRGNEPVSGSYGYGQQHNAPVSGGYRSNAPVSGSYGYGQGDQGNHQASGGYGYGQHHEPASGGYRGNEPASGSYGRGNEPVSGSYGYGQQHQEPASGGYRGNEPVSGHSYGYGRGNEPVSGSYGRGNEPVSGSYGYGQQHNAPVSGGYRDPAADYRSGQGGGSYGHQSQGGYGGGYPSDQGYPDDYARRQSRPRRYRDDEDDRPQSW